MTAASRLASVELVRALVARLSSSARSVERRTGITNAQLFLLRHVATDGALSVNELADRARTQQSTASIVISRLARAGLVRKTRAAGDARRVVLSVTPAGRALLRHAPAPPTAALFAALERLDTREARALATGLRALVRELGPGPREPGMLFEETRRPPRAANANASSRVAR